MAPTGNREIANLLTIIQLLDQIFEKGKDLVRLGDVSVEDLQVVFGYDRLVVVREGSPGEEVVDQVHQAQVVGLHQAEQTVNLPGERHAFPGFLPVEVGIVEMIQLHL